MSFFKRDKGPQTPPFPQPGSASDLYASPALSYHTSASADPYASRAAARARGARAWNGGAGEADAYANSAARGASPSTGGSDPYASSSARNDLIAGRRGGGGGGGAAAAGADGGAGNSNPYAKADDADEALRSELFAGYAAPEKPEKKREYGYEGREQEEEFDKDEKVEGIKQEMRGIKQKSLASTRNALRLAREAEDTARGTAAELADQSERIANSERYLNTAKGNNLRAEDKAEELHQLNRSIFRPVVVFNKKCPDANRAAYEDKNDNRNADERAECAKARADIGDTRRRLRDAPNSGGEYGYGESGRQPLPGERKVKKEAREMYQFEATASDDELEDELDDNLEQIHDVSKNLKKLAMGMGEEVDKQNGRLTRITGKAEDLEFAVEKNTDRLRRIR